METDRFLKLAILWCSHVAISIMLLLTSIKVLSHYTFSFILIYGLFSYYEKRTKFADELIKEHEVVR